MSDPAPRPDELAARLEQLWATWFGADPAPASAAPAGTGPSLVARLRDLHARAPRFGHQNTLAPDAPPDADGIVTVVVENQGVWTIGYVADGTDDPDAVVRSGGDVVHRAPRGLPGLLLRATAVEAVFAGSGAAFLHGATLEDIAAVAGPPVVPVLSDDATFALPAVWDLDGAIVFAFATDDVYARWHDLDAAARSGLDRLGAWSDL